MLSSRILLYGCRQFVLRLRWSRSITLAIRSFLPIHNLGTLLIEDRRLSRLSCLQFGNHRRLNILETVRLIVLLVVQESPRRWSSLGIDIEDGIAGQSATAYSMSLRHRRALDCSDRTSRGCSIRESVGHYSCHCVHIIVWSDGSWVLCTCTIESILNLVTIVWGVTTTCWVSKHRVDRVTLAHEVMSVVAMALGEALIFGSSVHRCIATRVCGEGESVLLISMHGRVESLPRSHVVTLLFAAIFAWEFSEYANFCLERVLGTKVSCAALSTLISDKLLSLCTGYCRLLSLSSYKILLLATDVIIVCNLHVAL